MTAQFEVKSERGTWNGKGDLKAALKVVEENQSPNEHLRDMALEILEDQMNGLEVGEKIMFNWACSVLVVKVERIK
jgi:hypothetical protein